MRHRDPTVFYQKQISGATRLWLHAQRQSYVWEQTKVQLIGVFSISLYTLIATSVIVFFVNNFVGLRVSEQEEKTDGCDFGTHGESSYHL